MKKNIFFGCAVLWVIICCVASAFQGNAQKTAQQSVQPTVGEEQPVVAEPMLSHEERTAKIIESLKGQTLDETFIGLLDDQQYYYPGYHHGAAYMPEDLEKIFSTRRFLKVFQEFTALPPEQAVLKINEFCARATKELDTILMESLKRKVDPSLQSGSVPLPVLGDKYMVCVTMLLAARLGEHELLLNQIDKMEPLVESYVNIFNTIPASGRYAATVSPNGLLLEDDCILSILIYALEQKKIDWKSAILQDVLMLNKKTIPLCRWDAGAAHYDFLVQRGGLKVDPGDIVERFDVYEFQSPLKHDDAKKKAIINTLKRCLSK